MIRLGAALLVVIALGGCGTPSVVLVRDRRAVEEWPPISAVAPPSWDDGGPELGRPRPPIRPESVE